MSQTSDLAISVEKLSHRYGTRSALNAIDFSVKAGETFALLGPNGGGKSTLFRVLTTTLIPSSGAAAIFGLDVVAQVSAIRARMGVVFQHPSLDKKLKVTENLRHQGHLYGMSGSQLEDKMHDLLSRLGIKDRAKEVVEKLSGGLQRRVELAKSLLHSPDLLIMDEPTTGLDPVARLDFWDLLERIKTERSLTVLFTTHFMEEADRSDRLAILDKGNLVATGTPNELKEKVGGDVISIGAKDAASLCQKIRDTFSVEAALVDGLVRIERPKGHEFVPALIEAFPGQIETVTLGKPTLEDVFIHLTGHRLTSDIGT